MSEALTYAKDASGSKPSGPSTYGRPSISLIIPTRGRPQRLRQLFDSLTATVEQLDQIEVVLVIDSDDKSYTGFDPGGINVVRVEVPPGIRMGALNMAGYRACHGDHIMLLNDDVVVKTVGWDRIVLDVFRAYPDGMVLIHVNDGIFGKRLCTFPFVTRAYCTLAGGICAEEYHRYRIDDHIYNVFVLVGVLGYSRIIYLPNVEFTHLNYKRNIAGVKSYRPDQEFHEADSELFKQRLNERKVLAARIVGTIQVGRRQQEEAVRNLVLRLVSVPAISPKADRIRVWSEPLPLSSETTRVTIGIVSADIRAEHARNCVRSVKTHTKNYDLVILDNNSSADFNHPREMNRILTICKTDFLVLMDDDVIVSEGWLNGLLGAMAPKVGVVTPVHRSTQGKIAYAGVVMTPDQSGNHAHILIPHDRPYSIQTLCSAVMMIDMNKCGHLRVDESYFKYFLDIDYGLRVWESGVEVICTPDVEVVHIGGGTVPQGASRSNARFEIERKHFVESWMKSGRYEQLAQSAIWNSHPEIAAILELPKKLASLLERNEGIPEDMAIAHVHEFADVIASNKALTGFISSEIERRSRSAKSRVEVRYVSRVARELGLPGGRSMLLLSGIKLIQYFQGGGTPQGLLRIAARKLREKVRPEG